MENENEGFEVVDKRRVNESGEASGSATDKDNPVVSQTEDLTADDYRDEESESEGSDQESVNVVSVLVYMLTLLANSAWQWMGLMINPSSGKVEQDLEQTKLAIDTFEFVAGKVTPYIDPRLQKEIQSTLSDLRVNYVEKVRAR